MKFRNKQKIKTHVGFYKKKLQKINKNLFVEEERILSLEWLQYDIFGDLVYSEKKHLDKNTTVKRNDYIRQKFTVLRRLGEFYDCETNKEYYDLNRRIKHQKYKKSNRGLYTYYESNRRAIIKGCKPSWADNRAIREIYRRCHEISKATGIEHHVDHMYALTPDTDDILSGLHVHFNMQILTAEENLKKSNKIIYYGGWNYRAYVSYK